MADSEAKATVGRQLGEFPAIGSYGFLSDCETGALLSPDGAIEWLCLPRFDSPSAFGALLDRSAGTLRLSPDERVPLARRYLPGTNVIETTWATETGWVIVRDALIATMQDVEGQKRQRLRSEHMLIRTLHCATGEAAVHMLCEPRPDYGRESAVWTVDEDSMGVTMPCGEVELCLLANLDLEIDGGRIEGRCSLRAGEGCYVALGWSGDHTDLPTHIDHAEQLLEETTQSWRAWLRRGRFPDHPWRSELQRSALTLKGLIYAPSGGMIAALTTSLPETPGGERNWDYRFTWIRDATFTLWALHVLGLDDEAADFMGFVENVCMRDPHLQIMYGIRGEAELPESTLDHLSGYEGASPVRIGNGAATQRQNDVYGALLDSIYIHSRALDGVSDSLWTLATSQVEAAMKIWADRDQGIWEARGEPRHWVSSKLMCWVALDRGYRLAAARGDDERAERWSAEAERIKDDILANGVSERGVFRQHYETDALDASTLLISLVRFLPADDERVRATVLAIADELTEHGLVLRYRTDETDDGLSGVEGTFSICSFWLVSALAEIGEVERARQLCERLLNMGGALDLYAEEIEPVSGRQLGNFPQAFTHLALINAVSQVISDEMKGERPDGRAVFSEMRSGASRPVRK
ncbi:MAG: glycoside hydrolase family 15 protein [Actinomycetota bacterium]|nr:glycoside hydrolase family 15 protein [Actinomycetota bacterium]